MHKWILLLTTALISFHQALAVQNKSSSTAAEAPCIGCLKAGQSPAEADAEFIKLQEFRKNLEKMTGGALKIQAISDTMPTSPNCSNFVSNGEFKKWGQILKKEFEKKQQYSGLYAGSKDLVNYCPNFSKFSDESKQDFWIMVIGRMVQYESSCDPKAVNPYNKAAIGLLALHKGKEKEYSENCKIGDGFKAERSLVCGLNMLNEQLLRGHPLFVNYPKTYWEVLAPNGGSQKHRNIKTAMRKYEPCTTKIGAQQNTKTRLAFK